MVSLLLAKHGLPLRRRSLLLALAGGLGLRTLGVHLLLELLLTSLLGLGTVDLLYQCQQTSLVVATMAGYHG